jgi:hypothetical protein
MEINKKLETQQRELTLEKQKREQNKKLLAQQTEKFQLLAGEKLLAAKKLKEQQKQKRDAALEEGRVVRLAKERLQKQQKDVGNAFSAFLDSDSSDDDSDSDDSDAGAASEEDVNGEAAVVLKIEALRIAPTTEKLPADGWKGWSTSRAFLGEMMVDGNVQVPPPLPPSSFRFPAFPFLPPSTLKLERERERERAGRIMSVLMMTNIIFIFIFIFKMITLIIKVNIDINVDFHRWSLW